MADVPHDRVIKVLWTDTPPVLDGRMDDACWQSADVAGDFRQTAAAYRPAEQQTEVRMAYDATYLYFFYRIFDDDINALQVGRPDDARDIIEYTRDDVIELFLDPGLRRGGADARSAYYQFMTAPLGARSDMRVTPQGRREVGTYDPDWDVVTHIGADYWTAEFRIPFASLVFDDEAIGTPQPGDEWGINFCRNRANSREWSNWSPTTSRSFHRPAEIGRVLFLGRKDGTELPAIRWAESPPLQYGAGTLELELPELDGLTVQWSARFDRAPAPDAGRMAPDKPSRFDFHLTRAGIWDVQVRVEQDARTLFYGRTVATLEPVMEVLGEVLQRVRAGRDRAAGLDHPAAPGLHAAIESLADVVEPLSDWLENPASLTPDQWQALLAQVPDIEAQWQPVRFGIALLEHADPAIANQRIAVVTAGATQRLYRDDIPFATQPAVELWAAGRERESFQIAVMPMWGDVQGVQFRASELVGEAVTLPSDCVEYHVVDYIKMHEAWGGHWVPDILNPGRPFDLVQNRTQPIWVDVRVPAGTPRGAYRGTITLQADGQRVEIPLTVHAYGFDIPEKRSIQTDPWYWPLQTWNRRYYRLPSHFNEWARSGFKGDYQPIFTPEIYEQHLQVLSRYRYAAYPFDYSAAWEYIRMYRETDGRITFDFSGLDWIIEMGQKYGADSFPASFGCNAPQLYPLVSTRLPIFCRETGEAVTTPAAFLEGQFEFVRGQTGKDDFIENPLYLIFMRQLTDYLREKNMLHLADYEIYDEPATGAEWRGLNRMHGFLKRYLPGLRIKSYGVGPWDGQDGVEAIGLFDVWAPILRSLTPERVAEMQARQALGESAWFYTCGAGYRDSDGSTRPHICLYQESLAPRMHGWIAWKLGVDGFLIFALNQLPGENVQPDSDKFFDEPIWHSARNASQGSLVYPGPDFTMIPSIRLAHVRDGLEDYEYFHVLKTLADELDPAADADLHARVRAALEVPETIVSWDWHAWTREVEPIEAKRHALAALILEVKARRP